MSRLIFCDDLDTEIKACLYSVSVNDTKDLTKCLERLRGRAKAFHGNISFSLDTCVLKSTAVIQKVSSLEQYANHLQRERDFLQSQVMLISLTLKARLIYEPVHEISNNVVCATSKASDQPAHTHSLIRAYASCLNIL